jgi:hypothetical protein
MSLVRFQQILRFIRFDDLETRETRRANDRLAPIRDVPDRFTELFRMRYVPHENVTIDEMLHPFRGRCPFKVYMPSKPAKYGLKIWILADSETSCCWNVQPYLGKVGQVAENGQGERVVRDLVTPVMASGRNVTVDNLFTSLSLAMWLLQNKLTIVGTIRKNRGEIPECMLPNRNRAELTSIFGFTKETTIVSYVPKKNRSVVLLSTLHHDATIDVGDQCKPEIITFHNGTKGGVDNLDKMCAQYTCKRPTRRWSLSMMFAYMNMITCQRGSARQCCKGHVSFLWEKPIFDPSQQPNPLSYNHKNLHD